MIIVSGVEIGLFQTEGDAVDVALKKLKIKQAQLVKSSTVKVSIDARRRNNMRLVYSLGLELKNKELERQLSRSNSFVKLKEQRNLIIQKGRAPLKRKPVVVGFGPCGMFAALLLAQYGFAPVVLERGYSVQKREEAVNRFWRDGVLDTKSNVQFGEGGAGTFSDGKLTTRINDEMCQYVLEQFVKFGAPKEILVKAKPHIGTDYLKQIVKNMREEIIRLGGQVHFESQVEDFIFENGQLKGLQVKGQNIETDLAVLALGHSARDTFLTLMGKQVQFESKPFSVGLRIEHLQKDIDTALFGQYSNLPQLGKGEYQLSFRQGGRGVYTFCMCPGGFVVPSASGEGQVVVNGMSEYSRGEENANSAVVVNVDSGDFGSRPQDGILFQQELEKKAFVMGGGNYKAPVQDVGSFLDGKKGFRPGKVHPSYHLGVTGGDFENLFPAEVTKMLRLGLMQFGKKLKGFDNPQAVLTGVETRTSSPVRIVRGENYQSLSVKGLYPAGEGAGYAGGIMSAAVDGLKVAKQIIERYCLDQGK